MEADVVSLGYRGEGVAKIDSYPVFIKGALPGERVRALVILVKKDFAVAKLLEVLSPSVHRVRPVCPDFGRCGGCDLMHLDYPSQLGFKREAVRNALHKIAHTDADVGECVPSDKIIGYRNKLSLPVRKGKNGAEVGLFAYNSHRIVPVTDCPLQTERVRSLLPHLRVFADMFAPYDEETGGGELRHFSVRDYGGALSVTVVVTRDVSGRILRAADDAGIECDELWMNVNNGRNNVILGAQSYLLRGMNVCRNVVFGGRVLPVKTHPNAFFQVNDGVADKLYSAVLSEAVRIRPRLVIDAYSGGGLMTALLAGVAERAAGIEIERSATAVADELMRRAGITNVRNICGDCAEVLPRLTADCDEDALVVLDPPRAGCAESVTDAVNACRAGSVIYVSCNPSTLARDLARMPAYVPVRITPFDMFSQTCHAETVTVLRRK